MQQTLHHASGFAVWVNNFQPREGCKMLAEGVKYVLESIGLHEGQTAVWGSALWPDSVLGSKQDVFRRVVS